MSLKLKIRLSIALMLVLLLGLGGYTFFSLQRLEGGARGIQRANFRSVEYGEQMLRALEALQDQPTAQPPLQQLRRALTREAANITEPGELELVDTLTQQLADYQRLVDDRAPAAAQVTQLHRLRAATHRMMQLNARSFNRQTDQAAATARGARRTVLALLLLSTVVGLSLVVRLPPGRAAPPAPPARRRGGRGQSRPGHPGVHCQKRRGGRRGPGPEPRLWLHAGPAQRHAGSFGY
ncbi:hypothetical protein [Hymenobacter sp. APR13]|uniref:hypothetical protein n=1 Tax=Hymenobacter sp. APR13 TaxID=1356852 RepID=UPI0005C5458A|nr:hypothetical protein [Hymenobacter sp. APR13]